METNFSLRKPTWKGLGVNVTEARSSREALTMSGLDWCVYQQTMTADNGIPITGFRANIRNTDDFLLGIVTDKYKVVQNREAFAFTDALLGQGVRYETAGMLQDGRKTWILAKLPQRYQMMGDWIDPYLVFFNSHDGSGSIKVALTPIRVTCQNTLNLALRKASRIWYTKHTGQIQSRIDDAMDTLFRAETYMDELNQEVNHLADITFNDSEVSELVEQLIPLPKDALCWVEDWETVKNSIFFRLVSKKKNKEYQNTMVYEEFCDLMAIAVVQVFSDAKSVKMMRVTKTLLSHWNVSEAEVLKVARQNTESLCPGKITNMLGVISGMLEPSEKELFPDTEKIPHDMYVLTNINQVNGATVMMYDSFLKRLHQKMGTFVLLPSSIHEVIVYPFDKNSMSFYEYQQMVMEINQTCVLEEEVLADSVYLYDGNQILLVADENGVYYNEDDFNN